MSDLVIETHGLNKTFRTRQGAVRVAVRDLDLAVPGGGVHGFLGPNGSGKTTTIRMLLGLSRPTGGTMRLFGTEVPRHLPEVMPRIGAVVESPKFSPMFTGRQNLLLLARSIGEPDTRVDEALETVSLAGRDDDRYKAYSLGMKQRLAIAATLLKHPQLLILDEPTNGLDPAGIREIRETIRDLGARGVTVLLSSHILAEVQQVCDSATIIGHGRMLASGRVEELIGSSTTYRVVVADPDEAARVLQAAGHGVRRDGRGRWSSTPPSHPRRSPAPSRRAGSTSPSWCRCAPTWSRSSSSSPRSPRSATAPTSAPAPPPGRRRPDEAAHRRAHPAALAPGRRHPAGRLRGHPGAALGRAGLEHPPGLRRGDPAGQGHRRPERRGQPAGRSTSASPTRRTSGSRHGRGPRAALPGVHRDRRRGLPVVPHPAAPRRGRRATGHRPRRDQPARRPHHAARHHLRRPRLEQRLDEQPAALRAPAAPGLAGQGGGGLRDLAGGQRRRPRPLVGCGVAARRRPATSRPAGTTGA